MGIPILGNLLKSTLAKAVPNFLHDAIDTLAGGDKRVKEHLKNKTNDPEVLAKLEALANERAQAQLDFEIKKNEQAIKEESLALADRDSAREHDILNDNRFSKNTRPLLTWATNLFFFGFVLFTHTSGIEPSKDALQMMFYLLVAQNSFYFGGRSVEKIFGLIGTGKKGLLK